MEEPAPASPETKSLKLKRHEWWRLEYRARRYLEHVSPESLLWHFRDIFNNATTLTQDSKLGVQTGPGEMKFWGKKLTHVLEEFDLRGHGLPHDIMRNHSLPGIVYPRRGRRVRREARSWRNVLPTIPKTSVVKYDKLQYLRDALDFGRIRLRPASSYDDRSLGPHRHDSERERKSFHRPTDYWIQLIARKDGTPVHNSPKVVPLGAVEMSVSCRDYYVWCGSHSLEPRLFADFGADACLLIHDPKQFARRLGWAAAIAYKRIMPLAQQFSMECRGVSYFDPFDPPIVSHDVDVPWVKTLRYAYQREWRIVFDPSPPPRMSLQWLSVTTGPLSDIAEILYVGELKGWPIITPRNAIVPTYT